MFLPPPVPRCLGVLLLPAFLLLLQLPVGGQVILTEFLAASGSGANAGLRDSDGTFSDWVEVHNAGPAPVSLENWTLTDKAENPSKWRFPPVEMAPGAYLIVFASEKNRTDPAGELHTNFKLGSGGEYLGLLRPDGTAATEFAPVYPPQLPEVSFGLAPSQNGYTTLHRFFLQPTPGALNGTGSADPGPILSDAAHTPLRPLSGEGITVTVRVQAALAPVDVVWLRWIVMYESSTNIIRQLPMSDGGEGADAVAGDGIYTAVIPGRSGLEEGVPSFGDGRLIRWFFTAADTGARESRWPLFADPDNSAEFLGTVSRDPANFMTPMPVWYWFAKNPTAAGTSTGTRGAVFYRDRFYDNIFIRRRGGATSTNSRKFDFNSGDHCYIDETVGHVEEANLNLSSQDSTLARPPMAFEAFRTSGHPACAAFPVLMRLGNSPTVPGSGSVTNTVSYFVEQVDERFLERHGLDPDGALYKMNQKSNLDPVFTDAIDGVEKRTRLFENNADLAAVCTALRKRSTATLRDQRAAFLFDHFELANMVNYLAVRAVINDYDDVRKNFYFYRDTRGDGEWMILPWDKDGTLGVTGDGGTWLPHPFFGDLAHLKQNANQWSLLWEALFNEPRTREMYLRRLRSVMDHQLQPSGVPPAERLLDQRADAWGNAFSPPRSVSSIKSFLNLRRTQLYSTYAATATNPAANRLIPPAQEDRPPVQFGQVDTNPVSGRQEEEFVQLVNPGATAVDLSGWSISGEIEHIFPPGTVLTANGEMFVAHDAPSFRARAIAPTGGSKLFVQGGWRGTLSARGGWLFLKDHAGQEIAAMATPAQTTVAQNALRVSKIHYAPPEDGLTPAGDAEYIELINAGSIPIDLSGIHFDKGITFTFPQGTRMEAGTRLLLVKNETVFSSRYGLDLPIAGVFTGSLDNAGERLRLLEPSGEVVLDFSFRPEWVPATLRGGVALVARDVHGSWTQWDTADGWRASTSAGGSPGWPDPAPPPLPALTLNLPGLLQLAGEPGSSWIVERSPTLDSAAASWSPLGTVVLGVEGKVNYSDPAPLPGRGWYRVRRP